MVRLGLAQWNHIFDLGGKTSIQIFIYTMLLKKLYLGRFPNFCWCWILNDLRCSFQHVPNQTIHNEFYSWTLAPWPSILKHRSISQNHLRFLDIIGPSLFFHEKHYPILPIRISWESARSIFTVFKFFHMGKGMWFFKLWAENFVLPFPQLS